MQIKTFFLGVLAFLGAASAQEATDAADLSQIWNLSDPAPTIEANLVKLAYPISTSLAAGNVAFKVFSDVLCSTEVETDDENAVTFTGTFLTNKYDVVAVLDPSVLEKSKFFGVAAEDPNEGLRNVKIEFCVRLSLKLTTAAATEVNFQETIIQIFVDLSAGFTVNGISVTPKERLIRTSTSAYEVSADLCGGPKTFNQGEVICVTVSPETAALTNGIKMRSIETFTFSGRDLNQVAISGNSAADLLTSYAACGGEDVCTFSTILRAEFYTPTAVEGVGEPVTGSGVALMQFGSGGRRLGEEGRELQEDGAGASEFDLTFDINPAAPVDESSAVTVAYGVVAAFLGLSLVM